MAAIVAGIVLVTALALLGAISACGPSRSAGPAAESTAVRAIDRAADEASAAGTNRALAVAAAAKALAAFPVPPGATKVDGPPSPAPGLRRLRAQIDEVDPSLTRTGWWVVPLPYQRVVAWYVAHTGVDPRTTYLPGRTESESSGLLYWRTDLASPAYSTPEDLVTYVSLGRRRTALRTDVTLAARGDRTAATLVPSTVTRVVITRRAVDGPDTTPRTVAVTDRRAVLAAVAAFDSLQGAFDSTEPRGCGSPTGIVHTYAVRFSWPGHTLVSDPGAELCGIGRGLELDGSRLPQTLENGARLDAVLVAAFDSA